MNQSLGEGTQAAIVYNTLLTHEYMKRSTIAEKTGFPKSTVSPILTFLRRKGLVEGHGHARDRRWKRHPISKPLYPAQEDFNISSKKSKKVEVHVDASVESIIDHITDSLKDLKIAIKKECNKNNNAQRQLEVIKKQLLKL